MFRVMMPSIGPKQPPLPTRGSLRRYVARVKAVTDPAGGETTFVPREEAVLPPPAPDRAEYSTDRIQYPKPSLDPSRRWDGLCDHLLRCFPVKPRDARPIDLVATVVVPAASVGTIIITYTLEQAAEGLFTHWGIDSPGGGLAFAVWDLMRNGSAVDNMFSQFVIDFGTLTDMIEVNYEIKKDDVIAIRCQNTNAVAPITARARLKGWYVFN